MEAALGRILDVDIAAETTNLAKQQILVQAVRIDGDPGKCRKSSRTDAPAITSNQFKTFQPILKNDT